MESERSMSSPNGHQRAGHPEIKTNMNRDISQEEIRRIIISDMEKRKNVFVKPNADMLVCKLRREKRRINTNSIVPIIGEDTIVYKDEGMGKEIPFQAFILNEF